MEECEGTRGETRDVERAEEKGIEWAWKRACGL